MKTKIVTIAFLLGSWIVGRCDILLNAGESFTYSFESIPFDFAYGPSQQFVINAHFGVILDRSTFDPTIDVVRYELFETNTNEPPFRSFTAPYFGWGSESYGANDWQDMQGALRVTVVTGSVILQEVYVGVLRPAAGGGANAHNSPFIPVMPPSLQIGRTNAGVWVGWPVQGSNWVLESSTTLNSGLVWTAVTNVPMRLGTWDMITEPASGGMRSYRLRRPANPFNL